MLTALLLPLLALVPPRLGPELTFADLRSAPPNNYEVILSSWTDGGTPVAVIYRSAMGKYETVMVRLRPDGTADPGSLAVLQVPSASVGAARAGDGVLAVWRTADGLYASRVGSNGALFTPGGKLIEDGPPGSGSPTVTCGAVRCLATGVRSALLLSLDGTLLTGISSARTAVAANHGFLVQRCETFETSSCRTEVLDDDGAVRSSVRQAIQTAIFDGTRYVAVSWSDDAGKAYAWTIDPATGVWSAPTTIVTLLSQNITAKLASNGSLYLLTMQVAYKPPPFPAGVPAPYVATLRLDRTLAPLDAAPKKIEQNDTTPPDVMGMADGFVLVPGRADDSRLRANLVRDDGSLTPAPPASKPVFQGLGSQFIAAAAASPGAILGVWTERDADRYWLRATRVTRGGTRLDAVPLDLSREPIRSVRAASDGAGFAVVWLETAGNLMGAVIDASGHAHSTTIRSGIDSSIGLPPDFSLAFAGGAYQIALTTRFTTEAFSLSTAGDVVTRATFPIYSTRAGFDGRHLLALLVGSTSITANVQDLAATTGESKTMLTAPPGATFLDAVIAPDGAGTYLLLAATVDNDHPVGQRDARYVMRISDRGDLLTPPYEHFLGRGLFSSDLALARIGGEWLAGWIDDTYETTGVNQPYRVLAAFDGTTLQTGASLSLPVEFPQPARPVNGTAGEALLLTTTPVPTDSLPAGRATVRVLTLGGRARAAGH